MSNISNDGKRFEAKIARWLKQEGYYFQRFYDSRSIGGLSAERPADYFVYKEPNLTYLELKSTINSNIPFSHLTQLKHLKNTLKYGIKTWVLFDFNDRLVYAIKAPKLYDFVVNSSKKSLNLEDCKVLGLSLSSSNDLTYILYIYIKK